MPAEQGGDPPELPPSSNRKDRPGHQHPEGVGHHAAYFLLPSRPEVSRCPSVPSWWALAVVPISSVAAVRARSSRRFIGSWGVPSGYGRFGGGVLWGKGKLETPP